MVAKEFGISPAKEATLKTRMQRLEIKESDIVERFVRSSGRGGQRVNKAATCVYLKHRPTAIEVKCQSSRYQNLNRFLARRRLVDKIETTLLKEKSTESARIHKIRKQKRKRSKRAKEKILKAKHIRSQKKQLRLQPQIDQ